MLTDRIGKLTARPQAPSFLAEVEGVDFSRPVDEPTDDERQAKPPARHRLVQVHPGSGRRALF